MLEEPRTGAGAGSRMGPGWYVLLLAALAMATCSVFSWPRPCAASPYGTRVIGACRTYVSAQTMYHREDWLYGGRHGNPKGAIQGYASDLRDLHRQRDPKGNLVNFIDEAFANARGAEGTPKHGYRFLEMKTIAGKPIDWTMEYALCAVPAKYGGETTFTLIVKNDGTVLAKDRGKDGFLNDYPADPYGDGWILADEALRQNEELLYTLLITMMVLSGMFFVAFCGRLFLGVLSTSRSSQ